MAGRHRAVHGDRVRGDRRIVMERNPNYRREPYPCEGMPGDKEKGCSPTAASRRRSSTPSSRRSSARTRRCATSSTDSYYDLEVFERTDTGNSYIVEANDSEEVRADAPGRKGFTFAQSAGVNSYIVGFNMLDPVIGWGDTPSNASATTKAAPGDLDRDRLGGVLEDLPEEGRRDGDEPAARASGLARGHARRHQSVTHTGSSTEAGSPLDRGGPAADGRSRLPQGRRRQDRPAARHRLRLLARRRPSASPSSTGWCASSVKLDIQLDVRATDNNQYQDKVRKGGTSSSGAGGTPTTRTRRTSCSCSTGRTQERVGRREHGELPGTQNTTSCSVSQIRRSTAGKTGGDRQDDQRSSRRGSFRLSLCVGAIQGAGWAIFKPRHPDPRPRPLSAPGLAQATWLAVEPQAAMVRPGLPMRFVVSAHWASRRTLNGSGAHGTRAAKCSPVGVDAPSSLRSAAPRGARCIGQNAAWHEMTSSDRPPCLCGGVLILSWA